MDSAACCFTRWVSINDKFLPLSSHDISAPFMEFIVASHLPTMTHSVPIYLSEIVTPVSHSGHTPASSTSLQPVSAEIAAHVRTSFASLHISAPASQARGHQSVYATALSRTQPPVPTLGGAQGTCHIHVGEASLNPT